ESTMSESSTTDVLVDIADGVMTVTFNRPARKNALTIAMYEAAVQALQTAASDAAARVGPVTGAADGLTSGTDAEAFMTAPPPGAQERPHHRHVRGGGAGPQDRRQRRRRAGGALHRRRRQLHLRQRRQGLHERAADGE